jgi:hypothetical protein
VIEQPVELSKITFMVEGQLSHNSEKAPAQSTFFVLSTDGRVSAALRNDWSEPRGGRDGDVPAQAADAPYLDGGRIKVHHSCTTSAVVNGGRVHRGPTASTAAICTGQCALGSSQLGLDDSYRHFEGSSEP